ncbi:MAG: UDP-2-acetamido-3-amino-2,3-dideoxy-glucuronate N-acetyltransferase [Acidobacteriota bacterium]|jgi:acetyltransferase-like isoleucine patch superfamily enzyme|nr:UDP-2-acetamido-3-amino-2,3-dideoxy-glucuronate N-acetyltransferase [Acidobacteriota bacterium]
MISIHPTALVASQEIGDGTRIWAFVNILAGARLGRECNICDRCFIENDVTLGDRVTVKCGVSLYDGLALEDGVFVGPGVMFTNDPRPRSGQWLAAYPRTVVRTGASLGAGAILLPGVTVGRFAMVGAGSLVTREVPDFALVYGTPARVQGHVCHCGRSLLFDGGSAVCACGQAFVQDAQDAGGRVREAA